MITKQTSTIFTRIIVLLFLLSINCIVHAGSYIDTFNIPVYRQYYHEKIDKLQAAIDQLDGKMDKQLNATNIQELNLHISDALFEQIDSLQSIIESNVKIGSNNEKIRALSYIENTLLNYKLRFKLKQILSADLPILIEKLQIAVLFLPEKIRIDELIEKTPYAVADILLQVFMDFPGTDNARDLVYLKYLHLHPSKILSTVTDHLSARYADSLINVAATLYPSEVYTRGQSSESVLGKAIQKNSFPLVKTIVRISQMPNALMYFPFLDDLQTGKKSFQDLSVFIKNGEEEFDSVGYYKLLVRTEIDYVQRMTSSSKDTPIAMFGVNGLRETLKNRAIRHFVTPINQLHEQSNLNIRMRSIDSLNAIELYYMMVMGESEIYTSSFKHSFHRMLARMGNNPRTDSLLLSVRFDYFKKFIKMCAGYNKLDTFLQQMPASSANALLKAFVANLDKGNSLEDATDVADAFSSISNDSLKDKVMMYVNENEKTAIQKNNERGALIYNLLKNIFLTETDSNKIDLKAITGIESIYDVDIKSLADDSGRIVQQVFFYGDEDGKAFFPPFLKSFDNGNWKVIRKAEWVEIQSLKSKITVFANLPLNYDANLDDSAQQHLNDYLASKGLRPTIVVHRGHSYWLPGTINRMPESARIVIIGSCGGYKNLSRILEVAPDAQIISTKEIGAGDINRPIMNAINQTLLTQNKIIWKDLWQNLTKLFDADGNKAIRETWENYVPPYRNLGAIFIKAYNKKELML